MKPLLLLPLAFAFAVARAEDDELATADLKKLADPAQRQAEVARIAGCDGKKTFLKGYRLHSAPQRDGAKPLLVLATDFDYDFQRKRIFAIGGSYEIEKPEELFGGDGREGVSAILSPDLTEIRDSTLRVFDAAGQEIRPFGGADSMNGGHLFDFDRDGILDCARGSYHEVKGAKGIDVRIFTLETVEPKPRCLLRVIYNWHPDKADSGNDWTFHCRDRNGDGFPEIAFGSDRHDSGLREPAFTFRWDPQAKAYTAGNIPEHSHIRVMKDGETLEQIAKDGGLGYRVLTDGASPPAPAAGVDGKPFVFTSMRDASDADLIAFFRGKPTETSFNEPEDEVPNNVPDGFWTMSPKQAALALAEANRTASHRKEWRLAIDDRNGIAPPKSGWWVYDWTSSGCYSLSAQVFALRFGTERCWLLATDYNSNGVVGRNPLADQPGHTSRVIALSRSEAGFLAETLFWLDRVRSRSATGSDESGSHMSSTADGFGSLNLIADGQPPREVLDGTVWVRSISTLWNRSYSPETCLNFVEHLLSRALPDHLGERWRVAPEIDRRSLMTPVEERLVPRLGGEARKQLAAQLGEAFTHHFTDPLPPRPLRRLVDIAGEEALVELLPTLERLRDSLPTPNAQDAEFAALEKRFGTDAPEAIADPNEPATTRKKRERYAALEKERDFQPGPLLREPVAASLRQLQIAGDAKGLVKAADAQDQTSFWALNQLRRNFPLAWQDYLITRFRDANVDLRRDLLNTLAAAAPLAAQGLVDLLTEQELSDLAVEVGKFELQHAEDHGKSRIPLLLELIRERKEDYIRRGIAMGLLAKIGPEGEQASTAIQLLLQELKDPQKNQFDSSTWSMAVDALSRLPGAAGHLDAIQATPRDMDMGSFSAGLAAMERLTRGRPDRDERLTAYVKPCFQAHPGVMNDVFMAALALDLKGLAPAIAGFATADPTVRDGKAATYWGGGFKGPQGQRYHAAREVTALWSEKDPATLDRMWIALAIARSGEFTKKPKEDAIAQSLRTRVVAALARQAPEKRQALIDAGLATERKEYVRDYLAKTLGELVAEVDTP